MQTLWIQLQEEGVFMERFSWYTKPHQQSFWHSALRVSCHLSNFPCSSLLVQVSQNTVPCLLWVKLMPHYVTNMWIIASNPWKQTRRGCCRTLGCITGQENPAKCCSVLLFILQLILQCNNQDGWSVDKEKANKRERSLVSPLLNCWSERKWETARRKRKGKGGKVLMPHLWCQDVHQ